MDGGRIKLHLGCGNVHLPGFVNVDINPGEAVDLVCDIRQLPYEANSVQEIYACAVIEHFGRREWESVLAHWVSLLSKGGIIRISTTDFESCANHYIKHRDLSLLQGLLIGGQKDRWDWHGVVFDFEMLSTALKRLGLKKIKKYDWRDTILHDLKIDDYSQAYLPHMEKETGKLMVLNVEGQK